MLMCVKNKIESSIQQAGTWQRIQRIRKVFSVLSKILYIDLLQVYFQKTTNK